MGWRLWKFSKSSYALSDVAGEHANVRGIATEFSWRLASLVVTNHMFADLVSFLHSLLHSGMVFDIIHYMHKRRRLLVITLETVLWWWIDLLIWVVLSFRTASLAVFETACIQPAVKGRE